MFLRGRTSFLVVVVVAACPCRSGSAFAPQQVTRLNQVVNKNILASTSKTSAFVTTSTELGMWNNEDDDNISGKDRVTSCVPYMLPILDGDHFGKYIYQRIPPLGMLDSILIRPLESLYHSIPFLGLGLFLLLSFGTRNTDISRPVRFNMQQAILIDIALIFPELFGAFGGAGGGLPRAIVEPASNFVYYAFAAAVLYSVSNNLGGKKPNKIPWISQAAEMQIGPM
jgi:hypothetical protein